MPTFKVGCMCGYRSDRYLHREFDRQKPTPCPECSNSTLSYLPSFGRGLTYFEEGRGRWIHNMADEPVYITSPTQYERECKERGIAPAGVPRGMPGCWT